MPYLLILICLPYQIKNMYLSPNFLPHKQSPNLLGSYALAQEVFLKSINTSYIGRISGKKEIYQKLENDAHLRQQQSNVTPTKKKRIDFSHFKAQEKLRETVVSQQQMPYLSILSISKQGVELFASSGCIVPCGEGKNKNKCRLQMLNESTLQLYSKGDKLDYDKLIASFNFDTLYAELIYDEVAQNKQLLLKMGPYQILFQSQKRKIVKHWYDQIQVMISQSKGNQLKLKSVLQIQNFYQERMETQNFFTKNCETGDILLFQDNHFFAKAQRFFTGSNFDHVGMVVKDSNYGILIFESNSSSGVCLTPWRYVIRYGWYKSIPKISWRRLRIERGPEFLSTLQKFVLENLKKNYHISFAKITAHESVIRGAKTSATKSQQPEESGYFCSQLIATLYKELGLLTRDRNNENYQPACKFYPKDLTQRSGRKLDKGQLSPEYRIYFDYELLKLTYRGIVTQ